MKLLIIPIIILLTSCEERDSNGNTEGQRQRFKKEYAVYTQWKKEMGYDFTYSTWKALKSGDRSGSNLPTTPKNKQPK